MGHKIFGTPRIAERKNVPDLPPFSTNFPEARLITPLPPQSHRSPRPLFILPSGQGRSSLARSRSFHRARYACDFGRPFREGGAASGPPRTKVESYQPNDTHMSYIEDFEKEFGRKLLEEANTETLTRWVSEKLLESYRNGITAGQKGTQVIRKGQSRRRGSFGKAQ